MGPWGENRDKDKQNPRLGRYKRFQTDEMKRTRTTEKKYMKEVVCGDMKKNRKRFFSYIKSKRHESEGVSSLINKERFLRSDSTKSADILNA